MFNTPPSSFLIVARNAHTSVALSDGSVLVFGGRESATSFKNDVWKSVNGGASWILVTSSAGWGGMDTGVSWIVSSVMLYLSFLPHSSYLPELILSLLFSLSYHRSSL